MAIKNIGGGSSGGSPNKLAEALKDLRRFYTQSARPDIIVQSFSKTHSHPPNSKALSTDDYIDYYKDRTEVNIPHEIVDNLIFTLLDNTEAAYFTNDLITDTKLRSRFEVNGGSKSPTGNQIDEYAGIENFVKIVYEPWEGLFNLKDKEFDDMPFYINRAWENPYIPADTNDLSDMDSRYDDDSYRASIRLMVETNPPQGRRNKSGVFSVNTNVLNPDRFTSPSLSAFMFPNQQISPATRLAGATSLFINTIPTIEMSRSVPFINITIVSPNLKGDSAGTRRVSLLRFLGASSEDDKNNIGNAIHDTLATRTFNLVQASTQLSSNGQDLEKIVIAPSLVGMELFTAPQTLVNPGINNSSADQIFDPMVPLMTLESLKISVAGLGSAAFNSKEATLSLTLHDRSRMSEIAPLIAIDAFALSYASIEWGWRHPDGGEGSDNSYGKLINAMRSSQLFNIQESGFNISNNGQVKVDMKLVARGGSEVKGFPIATGDVMPVAPFKQMIASHLSQLLIKSQQEASGKTKQEKTASSSDKYIGNSLTLAEIRANVKISMKNASSSSSVVSRKIFDDFMAYIRPSGDGSSPGVSEFYQTMTSLVGDPSDPNDNGSLSKSSESLTAAISKKLKQLDCTADPFYPPYINDHINQCLNLKKESHMISLGKLITSFVGAPLAGSARFDEVQMMFYRFNSNSGAAKDYESIANFLVRPDVAKEMVRKYVEAVPGMSVYGFLGIVNDLVSDPTNENYGMSDLHNDLRDAKKLDARADAAPGDDGSAQYGGGLGKRLKTLAQNKILEINDLIENRLVQIYGSGIPTEGKFVLPEIDFLFEALPAYVRDPGAKGEEGRFIVDPGKTILRVHVFDVHASASQDELLLLNALNSSTVTSQIKTQGNISNVESTQGTGSTLPNISDGGANRNIQIWTNPTAGASGGGVLREPEEGDLKEKSKYKVAIPAASNQEIKRIIKTTMPSITYGLGFSGISSFSLRSTTSSVVSNYLLLGAYQRATENSDPTLSKGDVSSLEDITVIPASATMTMMGCPLIEYAQEYFIDLGTGTTADSIYVVNAIEHTLQPGSFNTTVTLGFRGSSEMKTLRGILKAAQPAIAKVAEDENSSSETQIVTSP